ncbi:NlpC/P60 family protein [Parvularcula lutaonensis]|uniref:NlpC/P60 family protein n=1 Tax=Parvularcula lutaonensis TaxID=491923 RepID=A0ABV7MDG9_9PROT|nr:NlpC/P60 family protein [Parvularcula lutaonensis]
MTLSWLGTPYRHQASQKGFGTDCLGLIRGVYRELCGSEGEQPPPYPRRLCGPEEPLLDAARRSLVARDKAGIGDVLLFRMRRSMPVSHCGILIAPDRFVHAYEGQAVISTPLSEFWQTRISGVFAFPEVP